ncbi:MAG: hypothetical protein WBB64_11605 [Anaerolineales bacterium]
MILLFVSEAVYGIGQGGPYNSHTDGQQGNHNRYYSRYEKNRDGDLDPVGIIVEHFGHGIIGNRPGYNIGYAKQNDKILRDFHADFWIKKSFQCPGSSIFMLLIQIKRCILNIN